jgi:hypothetical protein
MIKGSCHCGAVHWSFNGTPKTATACNCTVCRRYGVIWAYGNVDEEIHVSGPTSAYIWGDKTIGFHFCPTCGCVAYWRGLKPRKNGKTRIAVNLRLAEPEAVATIPMDQFDGLTTFKDLPRTGKCVSDMWF